MSLRVNTYSDIDINFMRGALYLANTGMGRTWPNPSVGCVIVKDGRVVARARTGDGGRPHAESCALDLAGDKAVGATAYVTLEPCSHHGKTPPCVEALINAGIERVVIALRDPDLRVNGTGIDALKAANIDVVTGVLGDDVRRQLNGFILNRTQNRPHVTLKIASSMDGKVAVESGESKWITGADSRRFGHVMRSRHDAIAVGRGTVSKDNPSLTCRVKGVRNDPLTVLFDTNLRLIGDFDALKLSKQGGAIVFCSDEAVEKAQISKDSILSTSVDILNIPINNNTLLDISTALNILAERGITSVLVEGGPLLITSFIKAGLYDSICWFRAPIMLGKSGVNAIDGMAIESLVDKVKVIHKARRKLGGDILDVYEKE